MSAWIQCRDAYLHALEHEVLPELVERKLLDKLRKGELPSRADNGILLLDFWNNQWVHFEFDFMEGRVTRKGFSPNLKPTDRGYVINYTSTSITERLEFSTRHLFAIWPELPKLRRLVGPAVSANSGKRKAGRPIEHDWDGAREFARRHFAGHQLPDTKARAIELVAEWFKKNDGPKAPGAREIAREVVDDLYTGK